ncbi:hypothetical protein B0E46_05755 [Rhodanobacter sp. B04]|uniref:type IV pilin protein n=1 Tax=Rhodanobacter sp. B04 TaxID=1945860 RepID=UPI0009D58A01|nr:type IV pilin protein [Rhodanobacter sp. B04]OOG64896.1 hypothetical protein B0E46_05755 [Rhodanobacter sp. B04]
MAAARGFTLLELMIVVAIIAILAAIAIPAYGRYGYRARRPDGQQLLLQVANAEERYYATNNQYGALTSMGYTDPAPTEKGYYSVTVTVTADPAGNSSAAFTATAAPVAGGSQAKDDCGALSITNADVKSSVGTTTNGSCW